MLLSSEIPHFRETTETSWKFYRKIIRVAKIDEIYLFMSLSVFARIVSSFYHYHFLLSSIFILNLANLFLF